MLETAPARGVPREKELPPALRQGGEVSVMHILRADRQRRAAGFSSASCSEMASH